MIPCDLIYIPPNTAGGRVLKIHNTRHDQEACRWREAVTKEHARNPFSVIHNYISPWSLETRAAPLPNPWQRATHPWSSRCTPLLIVDTIKSSFCSIVPPVVSVVLQPPSRSKGSAFLSSHPTGVPEVKFKCAPARASWSLKEKIFQCRCRVISVHESDLKLF